MDGIPVSVYIKPLNMNTSDYIHLGMYLNVADKCGSGNVQHVCMYGEIKYNECVRARSCACMCTEKDECTVC